MTASQHLDQHFSSRNPVAPYEPLGYSKGPTGENHVSGGLRGPKREVWKEENRYDKEKKIEKNLEILKFNISIKIHQELQNRTCTRIWISNLKLCTKKNSRHRWLVVTLIKYTQN